MLAQSSPNSELCVTFESTLTEYIIEVDGQLFVIPFAKSATTGQHSPVRICTTQRLLYLTTGQDNTQYAFLQMDDRVLVYRGADQPDMSVINPESDVWQRIKVGMKSCPYCTAH